VYIPVNSFLPGEGHSSPHGHSGTARSWNRKEYYGLFASRY
jgi:hypothetical protein